MHNAVDIHDIVDRTANILSLSSGGLTHDPDLWFPDGSVVLESEMIYFKVYSGILCQASTVFRDMFSFPQPVGDNVEMYDGCPLVHMPDPARDLKHFLKALHDSRYVVKFSIAVQMLTMSCMLSYFDTSEFDLADLPQVVGMLRLGTKYDVPHLKRRATDVLTRWYPSNFDDFMALPRSMLPRDEFPRHALVANAAREADMPLILPAALLLCCATIDVKTLWDSGDLHILNRRSLFLGRHLLSHFARTRVQSFFFYYQEDREKEKERDKSERCQAPERCGSFCRIYASVYDDKEDPWMNPFYRLNWKSIRSTCCNVCAARWEKHHERATRELWEELPRIFDLPGWAELKTQSH